MSHRLNDDRMETKDLFDNSDQIGDKNCMCSEKKHLSGLGDVE